MIKKILTKLLQYKKQLQSRKSDNAGIYTVKNVNESSFNLWFLCVCIGLIHTFIYKTINDAVAQNISKSDIVMTFFIYFFINFFLFSLSVYVKIFAKITTIIITCLILMQLFFVKQNSYYSDIDTFFFVKYYKTFNLINDFSIIKSFFVGLLISLPFFGLIDKSSVNPVDIIIFAIAVFVLNKYYSSLKFDMSVVAKIKTLPPINYFFI